MAPATKSTSHQSCHCQALDIVRVALGTLPASAVGMDHQLKAPDTRLPHPALAAVLLSFAACALIACATTDESAQGSPDGGIEPDGGIDVDASVMPGMAVRASLVLPEGEPDCEAQGFYYEIDAFEYELWALSLATLSTQDRTGFYRHMSCKGGHIPFPPADTPWVGFVLRRDYGGYRHVAIAEDAFLIEQDETSQDQIDVDLGEVGIQRIALSWSTKPSSACGPTTLIHANGYRFACQDYSSSILLSDDTIWIEGMIEAPVITIPFQALARADDEVHLQFGD